jgi:hypothetical protein
MCEHVTCTKPNKHIACQHTQPSRLNDSWPRDQSRTKQPTYWRGGYCTFHSKVGLLETLGMNCDTQCRSPCLRSHLILCDTHLPVLDSAMMVSTTFFPGRNPFGRNTLASIPCRVHASMINVPHRVDHVIVHTQPIHPRTRHPVALVNANSMITPTPIRRKNPPTVMNSVPFPIPHMGM